MGGAIEGWLTGARKLWSERIFCEGQAACWRHGAGPITYLAAHYHSPVTLPCYACPGARSATRGRTSRSSPPRWWAPCAHSSADRQTSHGSGPQRHPRLRPPACSYYIYVYVYIDVCRCIYILYVMDINVRPAQRIARPRVALARRDSRLDYAQQRVAIYI